MDFASSPTPAPAPAPASGDEAAPPLLSLASAVFVPLPADVAADVAAEPAAAPASRIARINAALAVLDTHAVHVRANAVALVRRECARVVAVGLAAEPAAPPPPPAATAFGAAGLAPADCAAMIANMTAPAASAAPTAPPLPLPDFSQVGVANGRENAARETMAAVSHALVELAGLDAHFASHRASWERALKAEIEEEAR